jgi:HlyD family secretion protein
MNTSIEESGFEPKHLNMSARAPAALGLCTILFLLSGFWFWALSTEITGAVIAPGRIEVERHHKVVEHLYGGKVAEVLVKEGDAVIAGDALLRLDDSTLRPELAIVEAQFFEVVARRSRLEAERDDLAEIAFDDLLQEVARQDADVAAFVAGQERLFQARAVSLRREVEIMAKRRTQISDQIDGFDAQLTALDQQLALV